MAGRSILVPLKLVGALYIFPDLPRFIPSERPPHGASSPRPKRAKSTPPPPLRSRGVRTHRGCNRAVEGTARHGAPLAAWPVSAPAVAGHRQQHARTGSPGPTRSMGQRRMGRKRPVRLPDWGLRINTILFGSWLPVHRPILSLSPSGSVFHPLPPLYKCCPGKSLF